MDTFTNSEFPEENHPASEAQDAAPQEPQKEAEPQNPAPRSEPQSRRLSRRPVQAAGSLPTPIPRT